MNIKRQTGGCEHRRKHGKSGQGRRARHRLSRGFDEREVNPLRERKSLSNERTFRENLHHLDEGLEKLEPLIEELREDLSGRHDEREIRECVVKVKFEDFQITSAQRAAEKVDPEVIRELLAEAWNRGEGKSVRLLGAGVRFRPLPTNGVEQLEMF